MRYIRSQKKKGIYIGINIPTERQLRKEGIKGQELSKLTRQLKHVKPEVLQTEYRQADFDPETGEIYGVDIPTPPPSPVPQNEDTFSTPPSYLGTDNIWTNTIINGWKSELSRFTNSDLYDSLLNFMNKLISDNGADAVAQAIMDAGEAGIYLTWEVAYKQDASEAYMLELLDYLPEAGDFYKDEMQSYARYVLSNFEDVEDWEEPE